MKNGTYDPEAFVRTWQTSKSVEEIASRLKEPNTRKALTKLRMRAMWFRKHGVALKKFPRGLRPGSRLDYPALARLAKTALRDA